MVAGVGGVIVVVEMQLGVTSKTMQVEWAIHYRQSLIKKMKIGQKSQWEGMILHLILLIL